MVLIMSLLEGYKRPKLKNLIKPTLDALKELDGSGQIDEINARVINNLNLTEEIIVKFTFFLSYFIFNFIFSSFFHTYYKLQI